jgi:hypothetical protein
MFSQWSVAQTALQPQFTMMLVRVNATSAGSRLYPSTAGALREKLPLKHVGTIDDIMHQDELAF